VGLANIHLSELLHLLGSSILLQPNVCPGNEYYASKMLKQLSLSYQSIHACSGGCLLFTGQYQDDVTCEKCDRPRYVQVEKSQVPAKVLRYFPLIPKLRRMFSTPKQAVLMHWWKENRSSDSKLRIRADSMQWQFVDNHYPSFGEEARNPRLVLGIDGINPFSQNRSTYSCTPVVLYNLNLPPWLATKKFFVMLFMIIPGKQAVTSETVDTYLQPLMEELLALWTEGVEVRDASEYAGSGLFQMHVVLLYCMHGFLAYGTLAGRVTNGF
jgi:hypothetical protein